MTARAPHPADLAAQARIGDRLLALRRDRFRWRPAEYARLVGVSPATLWHMEHRAGASMQVGSLERRAAPLGLTLTLTPIGLPDVDDDPLVAALAALAARRPATATRRADNTAALTVARLNAARIDLGLTVADAAARIGITGSSLSVLHATAGATTWLGTLQRYTRGALGGRLALTLRPLDTP